ncbi:MAG: hypothetical protein MJK08_11410 [Campylobacterales bacterium]|nr:hypothetical protein [Campylobacterales bacterium]
MKINNIKLIILLSVVMIIFSACGGDSSSPINNNNNPVNKNSQTVTRDDNSNTTTNAQEISLNNQVIGNLEVADDIDYFKFILTEQTTVEFERKSTYGNVGQSNLSWFYVYNNSGTNLLDDSMSSSITKQSLTLNSGTYYIKISTLSNNLTGYQFILNAH